jgi:D-3-phosphoglycerate dehydrogenase / 2-oxoglutarate reductase
MIRQLHSGAASRSGETLRQIDHGSASKGAETVTFIYHDRGLVAAPEVAARPSAERRDALFQQTHLKTAFTRDATEAPANILDRRLLLLENIHHKAVDIFTEAGFSRISRLKGALDGKVLHEHLRGLAVIGIRSRTQLDAQAIAAADELLAIGCFGVGTNQVATEAARLRGIPVFNAPFANTRSVAELVISEIVMLFRQIFPRSVAAHSGGWEKNAVGSCEIRGKVLGIVGYGNIGMQLSCLAEAMGMKVLYFDIAEKLNFGNTERAKSLQDLLARSDVVSLHVPETATTNAMIGKAELAAMRKGSYLINNSRGSIVDLEALAAELRSGRLAGAAVDVFPEEPSSNTDVLLTPLRGLPNVILTPHIGGSTEEAQERIGQEVARKLADFMINGSTTGAVNFPQIKLPERAPGARLIHVHRKAVGMVRRIHDIFLRRNLTTVAEFYQADDDIGYAVFDIAEIDGHEEAVLGAVRAIEGTIGVRFC